MNFSRRGIAAGALTVRSISRPKVASTTETVTIGEGNWDCRRAFVDHHVLKRSADAFAALVALCNLAFHATSVIGCGEHSAVFNTRVFVDRWTGVLVALLNVET